MKVGVIGCGAFGQHHVRNLCALEDVEVVGVADVDTERLSAMKEAFRVNTFSDYEQLLNLNPEAVTIAVPTKIHKKVAMDALQKGIHVLVEKPIASTLEEGEQMIKTARKEGVSLMVGHVTRFEPTIIHLRNMIQQGDLGEVVTISTKRVGPYHPRIRDVGIIIDLGVHDIDIISYLYGEQAHKIMAAAGRTIHPVHEFEDHASILLIFDSNRSGLIDTNWLSPHKVRQLTAVGTRSIVDIDYLENALTNYDSQWVRKAKLEPQEPLRTELKAFLASIEESKPVPISGEEGLYNLQVALAAIESYKKGHEVSLRE
jgi:UDP-N-acetylglucosamine 3-dehydrogenase